MSKNVSIDYQFEPRKWQQECIDKQKRFTVLAVHRRAGKTTFAVNELILKALAVKGDYAYICPQLKQAKKVAWKPLKDAVAQIQKAESEINKEVKAGDEKVSLVDIRESDTTIKFWNGSEIYLLGSDNPDAIRGSKLAGVVLDEVAQMPKELWTEIVYPALMDSHGWSLFIGTPKGINLFSELFARGEDKKFTDEWVSQKFTCYETDALSKSEIETYKKSVPEEVFKREMLCDFSASAVDQLISYSEVLEASERTLPTYANEYTDLIMGVDVARFGNDRSVITLRKGQIIYEPISLQGVSTVELATTVKRIVYERQPAQIYVDGTGVGGGVVDILNSWGIFVNDINFGHKSLDKQYKNKRTEMWCRMADWIRRGGCLPKDADLISEIATPYFYYSDDNQKFLETKKQIRDRLGKSPDLADSLALTFAEDVPQSEIQDYQEQRLLTQIAQRQQQNFNNNPFAQFENEIQQSASIF